MATTAVELQSTVLKRALTKAQWRLIPLLAVCYLVAYMDRANISFAAETMNRDLHFSAKVYGLGAGLFSLSYALCEIPSSRFLLRFGARRWLARIMFTWGLLAAAMVFVKTPASLYTTRILLGMAEAGFFPGAVFYLSLWFPAGQRSKVIALFYSAYPMSNIVMGLLAGVLLSLNGRLGMTGWQWLFLIEALPALVLSVVVWCCLDEGPATAKWLTEPERAELQAELEKDPVRKMGSTDHSAMRAALRSGRNWMVGLYFFCMTGSSYAIMFSLPVMLRGLTGWSAGNVGYLIAASGAFGVASMIGYATHSDRKVELKWHILLPTVVIGLSYLGIGLHMAGWGAVVLFFVAAQCYFALQGVITSLPGRVLTGDARAVGIAIMTMCAIGGGFFGPYWMGWMRDRTGSYAVGVGGLFVPSCVALVCMVALMRKMQPATE